MDDEEVTSVYAAHISRLVEGDGEPSATETKAVLALLAGDLRHKMRERGVLTGPPALIGYHDHASWHADAIGDLAADAYMRCLVGRLQPLLGIMKLGGNVERVIRRNLDQFLIELQRQHDRPGHAVFKNIEATIRKMRGVEGVSGSAVIYTNPVHRSAAVATRAELEDALSQIAKWRALGTELATIGDKTQAEIEACINDLATLGVGAFRCIDLIDAAKTRMRAARVATTTDPDIEYAFDDVEGGDGPARLTRLVPADDSSTVARELLTRAAEHVRQQPSRTPRQRDRLLSVIQALAVLVDHPECAEITVDAVSHHSGVPRSTVAEQLKMLRPIFDQILDRTPAMHTRRVH